MHWNKLKKEAQSDLMWENPEDTGKIMHWNPTRWTENKRSFIGITNNYDYLHNAFERQSSPKETSDGIMISRCSSAAKHLSAFNCYFELSLCMCFLGLLDFLNASMQNPKKSISECLHTAGKTLKVLRSNAEDMNLELFYRR